MRRKNIISLAVYLATFAVAMFIPLTANATTIQEFNVSREPEVIIVDDDCITSCKGHEIKADDTKAATENCPIEIRGRNIDNPEKKIVHNIYLIEVNIDKSNDNKAAFVIRGKTNVNLILQGENSLKSGIGCAGLQVESGSTVTIESQDKSISNTLTAEGGRNGAGIGGQSGLSHGNIIIKNGKITAQGGLAAAGIGCGKDGGNEGAGNITIEGGEIDARGGNGESRVSGTSQGGAGIGYDGNFKGLYPVDGSTSNTKITLSGGSITAVGGESRKENGDIIKSNGIDCQILDSGRGSTDIVTNGIAQKTNKDNFNGIEWDKAYDQATIDEDHPRTGYIHGNASLKKT